MLEILLKYNPNLDLKDKYGSTSLHYFISTEKICLVEKVFEYYKNRKVNIAKKINVKGDGGDTCLHTAVYTNNYEIVMLLLQHKPDTNIINSENNNPLHVAVINNYTESLRALLCKKEDINLNINALNGVPDAISALHIAAINGKIEAMEMLLEHGADINLQSKKHRFTPLLAVCCQSAIKQDPPVNYYAAAKLLLEKSASVSAADLVRASGLSSIGPIEPRIKKLLEDYIREKAQEEEQKIRKEKKKKETQLKVEPKCQIEQLIIDSLDLNDYTYSIMLQTKGKYGVCISSQRSFLKNIGIYHLLKKNGENASFGKEGVTLSFSWNEEGKKKLSTIIALFESEMHRDICNIMLDNQGKILKTFNIEGELNSNNFSAPRKPETVEIGYFFRSVSSVHKFVDILEKLKLPYRTGAKQVIVSYPERIFLDQKACEDSCKIWAALIEAKKETTPTNATLENSKPTVALKLPPVEANVLSPELAEIRRLNKACRPSNRVGFEKRKGKKSNIQKPKRTALELESNPSEPNSGLMKHTKTTKRSRPVLNSSLLSEPKLLSPQEKESNNAHNAHLLIKAPTLSTPAPGARNSISSARNRFFNEITENTPLRIEPESSNRDARFNLVTGQEIPKRPKKNLRSESSTSASAKVSSLRKKLDPTHIRTIYYRNIHALLDALFHIEASDPALRWPNNRELYNKLNALRNALVHSFCMESNWADNREKQNILLDLDKMRCEKSEPGREITNSIYKLENEDKNNEHLVQLMNEELVYLKEAFKPFYENKDDFFKENKKGLRDACKASMSIIIEYYNILCRQNENEIEKVLEMGSPELKKLLNECRIKVRNQAMHVCEREIKYSNTREGAEVFVIQPEMFYNLLSRLSKLEEFVLVPSSELSLSFYPRPG